MKYLILLLSIPIGYIWHIIGYTKRIRKINKYYYNELNKMLKQHGY